MTLLVLRMAAPAALVVALASPCADARAESLRCTGGIAEEGDSRIAVAYKCGPPLLKDDYCAPLYQGSWQQPVPEPFASALLPCQQVNEWLYDRGPGNMLAIVRFRAGVVQSIRYSRSPR